MPVDRTENLENARRTEERNRLIELIRRAAERDMGGDENDEVGAFQRPYREEE